jgi:putative peptidoglycan lipid II flippase
MDVKISVIMPAYNASTFIDEAIASVREQSEENWELIIVDDASRDHTKERIMDWAKEEPRIHPIYMEENQGSAVARNAGIQQAQGRYLAFLDADDLWHPEKLRRQLALMEETGAVVTFTEYDAIDEKGQTIRSAETMPDAVSYEMMLKRNWMGCLTVIVDKTAFDEICFPLIRKRQDYALWLKLMREHQQPVLCLHQTLASHRSHKESLSRKKLSLIRYNYKVFRECEGLSRTRSLRAVTSNISRKIRGRSVDQGEIGMLKKTAFWMAILTLVSRSMGFFREVLIAKTFGSGAEADSYFLMTSIVGLLWLFSGVFGNSMIPLLIEIRQKDGDEEGLIRRLTQGVMILYFIVVGLMFALAPQVVGMIGYGFSADSQALTVFLFRIGVFSVFFSALFDLHYNYLKSHQLFLVGNFAGITSNLTYMIFFFLLPPQWRTIEGLSVMMVIALATKFLTTYPYLRKINYRMKWMPQFWADENFQKVLKLGLPIFLGGLAFKINGIIDKILATPLPTGSVSSMNYAYRLVATYENMVLAAFITLLFPTLARIAQTDAKRFRNAFDRAMRVMVDILIPSTLGMVILAEPIVTVIYRRGAFDMQALAVTTDILQIYGIGLIAVGINALLVKGFYANQETKIPTYIGLLSVAVNIILDFILVGSYGIQGLAAATVIASFTGLGLRGWMFYRTYGKVEFTSRFPAILPPLVGSAVMGPVIWQVQKILGPYYLSHINLLFKLGGLGLVVLIGAGVYLAVLRLFNPPEWKWLMHRKG